MPKEPAVPDAEPALPWDERAAELAGLATWTLDLASGALASSRTFRVLLSLPSAAPAPTLRDWWDAVHPDDRPRLRERWTALLERGEEYDLELRLLLPGGLVKHVRAVACARPGPDGRPVSVSGVTQDVTDARLAALEVERERDLSRTILGNLHEGFLLTTGGVVLETNEALCVMTGFTGDELVGTAPPYPFWPQDQVDELAQVRDRMVAEGGGEADVVMARKDGTRFPAHVIATPLPDGEGGERLWVVTVRDTTDEREYERLLLSRAETDPLTGVLNSRAFREALARATRGSRSGAVSLALIDVDHFKQVNDAHGHAVGDEVLCAVVERLAEATAAHGTLARVGGEEFALLMPGVDALQGHRVLEAALEALRSRPFPTVGTVTASAGVAQLLGTMDDDALYRLADAYLYEAKARGRDQVR